MDCLLINSIKNGGITVQFIVAAVKTQPISEIRDKFEEIFIEEKLLISDEFDISTHFIKIHQSLAHLELIQ